MKSRWRVVVLALAVAAGIGTASAWFYYDREIRYFRYDSFPNFSVAVSKIDGGRTIIRLTGEHVGSLGSIGRKKVVIAGNRANILVECLLRDKSDVQQLDYRLLVPEDVNVVTFGKPKDIVWRRSK